MKSGQTLVVLLVFAVVTLTLVGAAVAVLISSSRSATGQEIGTLAYLVAESGAENALIRLIRDPSYGGETLTLVDGIATITVAEGVVTSTGQSGTAQRSIQVTTSRSGGVVSVTAWGEIFP